MSQDRPIYLLGATGYTGALAARRLSSLGLELTIAGRSMEKLEELAGELGSTATTAIFDARDPSGLVDALEPGAIVLNCVGPFGLYSRALLEQLSRREVIYLDVCGEQSFVLDSMNQLDGPARSAGATVIHACAFESFLADLLAESLVGRDEPLHELSSFYWFNRLLSSPGTRLTMSLSAHWRTVSFRDGQLRDERPGASRDLSEVGLAGEQDHAVFVPYPEVIFFSRRFHVRNVGSHFLVKPSAVRFFGIQVQQDAPSISEIVERHGKRLRPGPSAEQRAAHGFGVAVLAQTTSGARRFVRLEGRNPYGLTAAILGWSCRWLLDHGAPPAGVLSPAEVFPFDAFLRSLKSWPEFFEELDRSSLTA